MSYHFYLHGGWLDPNYRHMNVEHIGIIEINESASKPKRLVYFETNQGSCVSRELGVPGEIRFNEDTLDRIPDNVMRERFEKALPFLRQRRTTLISLAMDKNLGEVSRAAFRREANRLYWKAAHFLDPVQFATAPVEPLFGVNQ